MTTFSTIKTRHSGVLEVHPRNELSTPHKRMLSSKLYKTHKHIWDQWHAV